MIIKQAILINSEGKVINSFSKDSSLDEYLVIDLICLKSIFKNIFSVKNNTLFFCFKLIFKSKYCRSTSSLASFLNTSIFDIYKVFDEISERLKLEIDPKSLKIILLFTTLK